jgi:hypothetical protein
MSNKYSSSRTNWLRYSWLLVVAFLFSQNVLAQVSSYTFSSSAGSYTPLTGATVVNAPTRTFDENVYANLPIGFTFNYNGTAYTAVSACANGYIEMGALATANSSPLTARPNAIAGLSRDLSSGYAVAGVRTSGSPILSSVLNASGALPGMVISTNAGAWTAGTATISSATATSVTMSSNATATAASSLHRFDFNGTAVQNPSQISYLTTGAVGSRVFTIEFHRVKRFGTTVSTVNGDYFSFQIKLYETSNNIEIVYGTCGTAATTTFSNVFSVGMTGAAVTDFNTRATTTNWSATTAGSANSSTCVISPTILPSAGLTFTWSPPVPCAGTPTGGTTTSTMPEAFTGVSFTLNVTGATSTAGVTGITYEWETSPDGSTWTPNAVTTAAYTTTITTDTYFRRRISCAGNNAWSTPIFIDKSPYCLAVTDYGCGDGDIIARVILNSLDNNSGTGCPSDPVAGNQGIGNNGPGYSNYTDYSTNPLLTTALQAGGSYSCTVYAGQYSQAYAVWIDYNDDNVFTDPSERVGSTPGQVTGSGFAGVLGASASFAINLACNPPLGEHRMRVRCMYNVFTGAGVTPCANNQYGETEDYLITITTPVACPAPTGLTASNATASSVDLAWTIGCAETAWDIEYGPTGFTPGTGTIVSVTGTPSTTLSGLNGGSVYDFYVNADCGIVDGESAQFGPISSATLPGNDNCGNAIDLATLTSPYTSTTVGATDDLDPCSDFNSAADVVFSINVPAGNILTIGQTSNLYDSYVHVYYGGACPGTTQIDCFDDPDLQLIEWYNTTGSAQTVYWVQDGYTSTEQGQYTLAWSNVPPPTCGEPTLGGGVPGAYNVTFTMVPNALFGVASGYEYEIVPQGNTPTGVGTASATATVLGGGTLTASTAYDLYFRTDCGTGGFSEWAGPFAFTTTPPPPANDDCANAIPVTCAGTPVSGTTVNSTLDFNYVNAGAGGTNTTERGVWYSLAGDDQAYTINTCSATTYDSRISVYSGTCGALVPIVGNDDNSGCTSATLSSEVTFNAFAGTTYYILVHGYQFGTALSNTGAFDMNISCSPLCLPIPGNDECANATVLTGSLTCTNTSGNNTCASPSSTLANPGAFSQFATLNDVWYTFTPTYADNSLTITNGTALQMGLAFYSGTCGAFTPLYSNANMTSGVPLNLTGFTIGVTYYVRVLSTVANAGTFDICVVEYPCATPTATATATSNTTVNVAITGVAGDYIIEYGPTGFTPGTAGTAGVGGTIVSTSTLTTTVTVAEDNNYDFYVRKDCSGTSEGYSFLEFAGSVSTYTVVPFTGTASITTCSATIYDHGTIGNYSSNANGTLVIYPASTTGILTLSGSFSTENTYDYLTFYEGVGTGGTVLADYTGTGTVAVAASALNTPITVEFTSDFSGIDSGFEITASCLEVCTDIPASAALTGNASVCPDESVDISVATPEIGFTYLWQKRTAPGGTWTTIPGQTSATLTATQTVNTEYRARIGCLYYPNAGSTVPTQSWFVTMNSFNDCYCTAEGNTFYGDNISNVTTGSINNSSPIIGGADYTEYAPGAGTTTTYLRGGQYSIDITTGDESGDYVAAWIDYNHDGTFSLSERLTLSGSLGLEETHSANFTVPNTAVTGTTTMRVRIGYGFTGSTMDACTDLSGFVGGETEDYTVTIAAGAANDAATNATVVSPPIYPACLNLSGNLALATDDPSDTSTGADLWYSFVAASNACRIAVSGGTATNVEIELQNSSSSFATTIATENVQSANGSEIMITDDLQVGTQYWVAIRNAGGVAGTFNVCIQSLAASTCDNGPTFSGLCSSFKADWVGTGSYTATFTSVSNPLNVYTHTTNGSSSWIPLTTVVGNAGNPTAGGLQYGESYSVVVSANFTLPNANGDAQTAIATSSTPSCTINILPAAPMNVGVVYRSTGSGDVSTPGSNPRAIGSWVQTNIFMCGATSYQWQFTEVDYLNSNPQLPIVATTVARQIRLTSTSIAGLAAGKRYRVKVAPVFAWGTGSYDEASSFYVQIVGSAGMVVENNEEVVLVDKSLETGVFASLYPNPNNGEMVNINIAGIESESVNIRIMDASGRTVWSNNFFVEGLLATTVNFDRPLAAGVYMVEMTYNGEVSTQRMIVQK